MINEEITQAERRRITTGEAEHISVKMGKLGG
jgi:hypothetical protein